LQNCDLYANPINLTFNHKKQYQTAYGGVLTILSTLIVIMWLGLQALAVKKVTFNLSYVQNLVNSA